MADEQETPPPTPPKAPIRAFISYSWTTPDYEEHVLEIATRLRDDGVDVVLDKWDLKEGDDAHAFMERMVTDVTISKVVMLSDAEYARKADGRERGVGTEAQIVSKELYGKVKQGKFIPVLTQRENGTACLPAFLGSRKYIDFSSHQDYLNNYDQLLRAIYEKPLYVKPPIGPAPTHLDAPERLGRHLRPLVEEHENMLLRGNSLGARMVFSKLLEGLLGILDGLFIPEVPPGSFLDEIVREKLKAFTEHRDAYIDALLHFSSAYDGDAHYETIRAFLEAYLPKVTTKDPRNDAAKVAGFEILIYTFAVLLKQSRFAEAAFLLGGQYLVATDVGLRSKHLTGFHFYATSLDKDWNQREKRNRASMTADVIKERASHPKISFEALVQVEAVFYIRAAMDNDHWYPRLLVYAERWGMMELFARAKSTTFFRKLLPVLGCNSKEELTVKLTSYMKQYPMGPDAGFWGLPLDLTRHIGIGDLGTSP